MKTAEEYMRLALSQARLALDEGEVPVGAVLVRDGLVLAQTHNLRETSGDVTAHAELLALRLAGEKLGSWKLEGCTLYVTLEPCAMCAAACAQARLAAVVFGAFDPASGGCGSVYKLTSDPRVGGHVPVTGGVCGEACRELLERFFRSVRDGNG